ncbi:MAG: hypothetical protein Q9M33_01410 [Robiginitomaculum sp.]|nr:hypothetical protein [Robiginitomaculum sp.]MDQ7076911.1 hypothetical protein [Robiginitomaculum sp.]
MRFLIASGIAALALFNAPGLMAQELSIEEALGLCMKVGNPQDRLACFEALARAAAPAKPATTMSKTQSLAPATPPTMTPPAGPNKLATAETTAPTAPQTTPKTKSVAGLEVKTKKKRGGLFPFNRLKKSKQKYIFVKPGQTPPARVTHAPKLVKRVAYDGKVLKAWRNAVGDLYIALDNGEVWKHADPGQPRIPKPNASIRMKPGLAGAWFMSFANKSPRIRVRLIRTK